MNWTLLDYVTAAGIIGVMGGVLALLINKSRNGFYRLGAAAAVATCFVLVWGNLAVGVVGEPENPVNLLYFATLLIGAVGAFITRFSPRGMAATMATMAVAQCACMAIAFATRADANLLPSLAVTGLFTAGFAASAWLFLQAARTAPMQQS